MRLFDDAGLLGDASSEDIEVLSSVVRSEAEGHTRAEQVGVAWATVNHAAASGKSVAQALQGSGRQGTGGRFASTRRPGNEATRAIARDVLELREPDPTGGATSFFEPAAQDKLYRAGTAGYRYDADGIRRKWTSEGAQLVAVIGRWEFYRGGKARTRRAGGGLPIVAIAAGLGLAGLALVKGRKAHVA